MSPSQKKKELEKEGVKPPRRAVARQLTKAIIPWLEREEIIVITGARQTGKSTLCKELLKKTHRYVSLEDPDRRQQALEAPRTFLKNFSKNLFKKSSLLRFQNRSF